jgi:hypothetical protein
MLDWRENDEQGKPVEQCHALVVRLKDGTYAVTSKEADETFEQLKKASNWESILERMEREDFWLQDPLPKLGDKIEEGDSPRDDDLYCWVVTRVGNMRLLNVAGVAPRHSWPCCTLTQYFGPDDCVLDLVPGIGITKYDYSHHGTIMEAHIRLREFGKKKNAKGSPTR